MNSFSDSIGPKAYTLEQKIIFLRFALAIANAYPRASGNLPASVVVANGSMASFTTYSTNRYQIDFTAAEGSTGDSSTQGVVPPLKSLVHYPAAVLAPVQISVGRRHLGKAFAAAAAVVTDRFVVRRIGSVAGLLEHVGGGGAD